MNPAEIERAILAGLPGARVAVQSDDNTHFEAVVVAPQFTGKRLIQRHQMVYATLGTAVGREIHALSIQAHSPEEWAAQDGG
jgi:acid stress-induced BolA-like protein IbaG/YrbA